MYFAPLLIKVSAARKQAVGREVNRKEEIKEKKKKRTKVKQRKPKKQKERNTKAKKQNIPFWQAINKAVLC